MSGRFIDKAYHFILYLIGIAVLLAAVAITIIRLALPDIGQHRNEIEAWVSDYMGQDFVIDSISADWQGWNPRLYLSDIHLRSDDGLRQIVSFDTAILEVSPFRSLWKLQPVPRRLVIAGLRVSVSRLPTGAILVEGMNINSGDAGRENEFTKWLFGQDRIEINNADILWLDHKHRQAPIQLTDVSLAISTEGSRSQIMGEAKLPGKYGDRMNFALDASGDLWSSDWSGELYAAATQVNPDNWYREFQPEKMTLAGGSADMEIWSNWKNAELRLLQGRIEYHDFAVLADNGAIRVEELASRFRGEKLMDANWRFSLKLDRLVTENGSWPGANLELVVPTKTGQRYALSFDYLNLADLMPLAESMESIPGPIRGMLETTSIHCELLDGVIAYDERSDPAEPLAYDLTFRDLYADLGPGKPAVDKLSGRLRGSGNRASITMNGTMGRFSIPDLYSNQLLFNSIDGALSWSRTGQGWELQTDYFSVENDDMSLTIRGGFEQDDAHPAPYLNLVAEIHSERLENMFNYMPYTQKFRIREWMERSLHAGYVDSAIAVIRGYADEYPFRNNNGQLRGVVNLSDSIVEYSPHWPAVDDVDAEILFENEVMTADIRRGSVFGAEITGATGIIHDLTRRPKIVVLEGNVRGLEEDLEIFISQSPLATDRIIKHANRSLVAGSFDMDLDMIIPIKAPQLQTRMAGTLRLEEARLASGASNVELEQVNGTVNFTRDSVFGRDLAALFEGQPVSLAMSGSKNSLHKPPAFIITGHSTDEFIIEQIIDRFPGAGDFAARLGENLSGETDWQARFTFEQNPEGLVQQLVISSDLYGLALDLPKPLWKPTYDRRLLTVSKMLHETAPTELKYEGGIQAKLQPGQDNTLERLDISLGGAAQARSAGAPGPARPGQKEVNLTGYMERLILDEWRNTIASFTPERKPAPLLTTAGAGSEGHGQGDAAGFFGSADVNIELETGLLNVFKQSFTDSSLQASRSEESWRVAIQGENLEGEFFLPRDPSPENRVEVNLDKLVVSKVNDDEVTGKADPKTLPPVHAEIADLTYGDYRLGSMRLTASPIANGLSFEEIGFEKPEMIIEGTGVWEKPFGRNRSNFTINLKADKLHKMLDTFGYDAAIKAGKTRISIDAGWEGSPDEFSLDKLAGTFNLWLEKGQLLEVSPAAGRLFGLLSIQTLPRRLSLDFTDLFGKGLAFDRIKGSFNLFNGNAYTNDLRLTGPGADVSISGRTGLTDQDYDQIVTVTPQFADNLPVASALLGPVGIGVGAVLYLAGNMFESINDNIDKMLSHQYTIKGNWYNPQIEKLKDPPADSQVNAQPAPEPAYP